jgi:hypothetical protein
MSPRLQTRCRRKLELESLEDRLAPTVTFHGGALLPHVEAQAVYLGSDWTANSSATAQANTLDAFVASLVNGPYMDMLSGAGYNVGRGTASAGAFDPLSLNKNALLTDATIQSDLQLAINSGTVNSPDANRLYVVFVEDNVAVGLADGTMSRKDFLGYHGAFAGTNRAGTPADIRYAVIPYPGGTIGNLAVPNVSALQSMTEVASHEIAESVTDPDVDYGALGWYDDALNEEVADIADEQMVVLGGYLVQRVADKHDQPMTPAGAVPLVPASFVLLNSGVLFEHTTTGWTYLDNGVASISSQSIDLDGRAMVDVLFTNGDAYEYYDNEGWVFLRHNVKEACAGQGVSYVLTTSGQVYEYHDVDGSWSGSIASGIASIDAGTDRYGVNMVDAVSTAGVLVEYSDTSGAHALCSTAMAVSAGQFGVSLVLLTDGRAFAYSESTGQWTKFASGVSAIAAGTDPSGAAMYDFVYTNGTASEWRTGTGWQTLATGVAFVTKARAGLVGVVYRNGNYYEHTLTTWTPLTTTVREAA